MSNLFEGHPNEYSLEAANQAAIELSAFQGISAIDKNLARTIASDSSYRQALSGADEKFFIEFSETEDRQPNVYAALKELGYKAIAPMVREEA